jgi:hypothetical protein
MLQEPSLPEPWKPLWTSFARTLRGERPHLSSERTLKVYLYVLEGFGRFLGPGAPP